MTTAAFPDSPVDFGMFDWVEYNWDDPGASLEHRLRMAEVADKGGFYGWHIAEHHGSKICLNISPGVLLSAAIQRTKRIRIGSLNYCLPWHNPYRLYNEICELDQLSRGRFDFGMGRGSILESGMIWGIKDEEEARGRYRETVDILLNAFQNPVLNFQGTYFNYQDIDLLNAPYQRPYPPLWFPSSNPHTEEFLGPHGYNVAFNSAPPEQIRQQCERYRELWVQHRNDPGRHNGHVAAPKLAIRPHIVVTERESEAMELLRPAHEIWASHIAYFPTRHGIVQRAGGVDRGLDFAISQGLVFAGTPESVRQQMAESIKATTANYILGAFSFGDLRPEYAERSATLFAEEVMPAFKTVAA